MYCREWWSAVTICINFMNCISTFSLIYVSTAFRFFFTIGGMSSLTTVLIIVGSILLLVSVVGLVSCMCLLMRRQQQRKWEYNQPAGPRAYTYGHNRTYDEEEQRMEQLHRVIHNSLYLQPVRGQRSQADHDVLRKGPTHVAALMCPCRSLTFAFASVILQPEKNV